MAKRRTIRTISLYCRRMLRCLAPLLVATALLAGGCATETVPDSEKVLIESSSSPLGPSKDDGKPKPKADKPKKPKAKAFTARRAGVRISVPAGWTVLSESDLSFAADSPRGKELAERTGLTVDQLRATLKRVDLYLMGFASVMTVAVFDQSGSLPSQAKFEAAFIDLDVTTTQGENVDTPLGTGRIFGTTISLSGTELQGGSLYVVNGSTVVDISVVAPDRTTARSLLNDVIPTLKRA